MFCLLLDALLMVNLALSVGLVLLGIYAPRPARLGWFPALLLLSTCLRAGLNLAITALLWSGGSGWLIQAFGQALMGGRVWLGALIWALLFFVQWSVIPKGVARLSTIGQRFTLDAMPGKQMAVDADLYSGIMDSEMARSCRREIEREADFYGAMDGLGSFVLADCFLACCLMLANLGKAGLVLCLGNAVIATLCAALAWLASNLMMTRAAISANLGIDLCQSRLQGRFLVMAAGFLLLLELARLFWAAALPAFPVIILTGTLHLGLKALRSRQRAWQENLLSWGAERGSITLEVSRCQVHPLLENIPALRRELAEERGFILPGVRLRLSRSGYRICIHNREVGSGTGPQVLDHLRQLAHLHASRLANASQLLDRSELLGLPQPKVEQVLVNLLEEGYSIRKLDFILSCLAQCPHQELEAMTEWARVSLGRLSYKQVTGVTQVRVLERLDETKLEQLRDGDILLTTASLRTQWRRLVLASGRRIQLVTPGELSGTAVSFRR